MKRMIAAAIGIVAIVVALAAVALYYSPESEEGRSAVDETGVPEVTTAVETPAGPAEAGDYDGVVEIVAEASDEFGIEPETAFVMNHVTEVPVEEIKANLSFEPEVAFDVEALGDKTYKIQPVQALAEVRSVKLKYAFNSELYGAAFQVKEAFQLKDNYPADERRWVDVQTGIELTFNRPVSDGLADYVSIEPEVAGDFSSRGNVLIFIPSEGFEYDTTYVVSVDEGFEREGEDLGAAAFSFTTEGNYDSAFGFDGNMVSALSTEGVQTVAFHGDSDADYTSMEIEAYRIEGNPNELFNLKSHTTIMKAINDEGKGSLAKTLGAAYEYIDWRSEYLILDDSLSKGVYYLNAVFEDSTDGCFVQVTDKNAYMIADSEKVLLWVAEEGNMDLSGDVYLGEEKIGTAGPDGLVELPVSLEEKSLNLISFMTEDETIYLPAYAREAYEDPSEDYYSFMYTDRSVYKRSDTIHVSGYLKNRQGAEIEDVRLALNYHGKEITSQSVELSAIGTYEAAFTFEEYDQSYLDLEIYVGEDAIDSMWLTVFDFEKPTYQLQTGFDKEVVMAGEEVTFTGSVGYFDGTPLPGGTLDLYFNDYSARFYDSNGSWTSDLLVTTEDGSYQETFTLKADTYDWRPVSATVYTTTRNLQDYYASVSSHVYLFPKKSMLEVRTEPYKEDSFRVVADFHEIDMDAARDSALDPDDYRGIGINDTILDIRVDEIYYEKVFVEEKYNAVYKEVEKVYEYVRREEEILSSELWTGHSGSDSMVIDQLKEDRYYMVTVGAKDEDGSRIEETVYYGSLGGYNGDVPLYEIVNLTDDGDFNGEPFNKEVQLELLKSGESIEQADDWLLVVEKRAGILNYQLLDSTVYSLIMDESRLPNVTCKFVYFNGDNMLAGYQMQEWLSLDESSRELLIDAEYGKEGYKPGEKVTYKLSVTDDKGQAVKADVNISVVDEAVFAVQEDYREPLSYIYEYRDSYYNNIIAEYLLAPALDREMMAEGGEGGDESYRSDFEDTAFFTTVTTDAYGRAQGSFDLPDNITGWRVTYTAYTKEAQAGKLQSNIDAGLDFFTDVTMEETYLEDDDIWVKVRTSGKPSYSDKINQVTVLLKGSDGDQKELYKGEVGFAENQHIQLGQLAMGDYELLVNAQAGNQTDNSRYGFSVVDQVAGYSIHEDKPVTEGMTLTHNNNLVDLTVYNEVAYDYYRRLSALTYNRYSRHNLMQAAAVMAELHRDTYFGEDRLATNDLEWLLEFDEDGLLKPLKDANGSLVASARGAEIGVYEAVDTYTTDLAGKKIEALLGEVSASSEDYQAALWLGAGLGQADYYRLGQSYDNYNRLETPMSQLYLIRALLVSGELTKGRRLLDRFVEDNGIVIAAGDFMIAEEPYLKESLDYMLLAAYVQLERLEEADLIVKHCMEEDGYVIKDRSYEVAEPELYLYYSKIQTPETEIAMTYTLGGGEKEAAVGFNSPFRKVLTAEEAGNFKVIQAGEGLVAAVQYIGRASDLSQVEADVLTKTYHYNEPLKVGDLVSVELNFNRMTNQNWLQIQDQVPKGLTYFSMAEDSDGSYSYCTPKGDSVDIRVWFPWDHDKGVTEEEVTVNYVAIATAVGSYRAEPTLISEGWRRGKWIGEDSIIEIAE